MNAYLLTWNPEKSSTTEEQLQKWAQDLLSGKTLTTRWSVGNNIRIKPGDRVFLLRQGNKQPGLLGSGQAIKGSHSAPGHQTQKNVQFIEVQWDSILTTDQVLPRSELINGVLPLNLLNAVRSGVAIPTEVATQIASRWAEHRTSTIDPRRLINTQELRQRSSTPSHPTAHPARMSAPQVEERLALLRQDMWSFHQIQHWFGVDLNSEPQGLLAQYRIWAEEIRRDAPVLDLKAKLIYRNLFEMFLQRRELVSVRGAAVSLAMDEASLKKVLSAALVANLVSRSEAEGDFPDVYRSSLIGDFHTRFPKLKQTIFNTFRAFATSLHSQIKEVLGIDVQPVYCLTSQAIGTKPPEFARGYDSITNEPMCSLYQLWLETHKPIQLRPDMCSFATYFRFENVLRDQLLGPPDQQLEITRDAIRKYFDI
jgi:hypothetical protein